MDELRVEGNRERDKSMKWMKVIGENIKGTYGVDHD